MGFISESDVQRLMQDQELMGEVAKAIAQDPATMDGLSDDIADKLQDQLEDDADMRRQIVDAAVASPEFKRKIVAKLADDLS